MKPLSKASLLAAAAALIASAAIAATAEETAAYQKRDDTMKQIGRNFYVGIGRVIQGQIPRPANRRIPPRPSRSCSPRCRTCSRQAPSSMAAG